MWAQGLTVGVVIASGVLAGVSVDQEKDVNQVAGGDDHSWRDILGEYRNLCFALILSVMSRSQPHRRETLIPFRPKFLSLSISQNKKNVMKQQRKRQHNRPRLSKLLPHRLEKEGKIVIKKRRR